MIRSPLISFLPGCIHRQNNVFRRLEQVAGHARLKPDVRIRRQEFIVKFSRAGAEMFRKKYLEAESIFSGKPFQRAPIFEKAYVTDMLQYLTNQGVTVTCQPTAGRWREIDTLQDFENLTKLWGGTA